MSINLNSSITTIVDAINDLPAVILAKQYTSIRGRTRVDAGVKVHNALELNGQTGAYYKCSGCSWTCTGSCTGTCPGSCSGCGGAGHGNGAGHGAGGNQSGGGGGGM